MALDTYTPSEFIRGYAHNDMPGLAGIVRDAEAAGYRVFIDFEDYKEWVSPETAAFAAHEMGESVFGFVKENKVKARMLTIPGNDSGYEWLCDYTAVDWLDSIINANTGD